ncbi:MAG: Rieske 2Fe-2S domain-containing protein [Thermoflexibacter sp.]|jgi:nitrite reductase/ring-hydroxylating ferredoxin subunit|nr:Rieske 2Fe-2S domain-containing protein [Thermoflexibacter sp.]
MEELRWYKIFDSLAEAEKKLPLNQSVRVVIKNISICLSHSHQGFFAVQDECSHLKESLSRGRINNWNEVICPWHAYRFDLATGEETSGNGCASLQTFPVALEEDGFFIGLYA